MEAHPPDYRPSERITIGFLATSIDDSNGRRLWTGINEACQKNGLNLVSFTGSELDSPGGFSRQANMIYDMVDRGRMDGMVIWASSLSTYVGLDAIQRFCEMYRPRPLVAVGLALEGIPSIILDSYQGMRAALLHLVQEHGRRRVAYFRGPEPHPEAEIRYRAYRDVVREYGLSDDPALVTPPKSWMEDWGREAARLLVEERHAQFDAIASVNDRLAIGAIEYLHGRGIDIPGDVAITGFDNSLEGRLVTPPLTTVSNRMKDRGRLAVRLLMDWIAGEPVEALITLPAALRLRQSCGCPDPLVVEAGRPEPDEARPGLAEELLPWREQPAARREAIQAEMEQALDLDDLPPGWAAELLDSFLRSREGNRASGSFLVTLQRLLSHSAPAGSDLNAWQKVISVLRARSLPLLGLDTSQLDQAERCLHQARVMIGETSVRAQGYLDWKRGQQLNDLMRLRQGVSGAQDLKELVDLMARDLCSLGIQRCYLALYADPEQPVKAARLVLAYDETGRHTELEGKRFSPSWQLNWLPFTLDDPQNLVVYPLYFRDEQLGFMLLDARAYQETTHRLLCEQVSSALKSVMLVEQNSQLYRKALEAQQEAEDASLLKSRFLSMVSHELLTPMVLLTGLSEMMLREEIGNRPPLPDAYLQDLKRIHAGAQQLGSLVRDVLDLARSQLGRLKLAMHPVSVDEVCKPVILVGEQMARSKGLAWRAEMPPKPPQILGDTSRLQQVMLNLVSNAVKFTSQGEVALIVSTTDAVSRAMAPAELRSEDAAMAPAELRSEDAAMAPAELRSEDAAMAPLDAAGSVTIAIQDTGLGVPPEEQEAIFDEFRQSERTVSRGYGGLGIGLAICRQLIELHGGKIGMRSRGEENSGSTFYFTLPVLSPEKAVRPAATSQSVLVLTNQAEQAAPLRRHLLREGFQVEVLGIDESPNWLATVLAGPPGAVVLDMPAAESGWELMELLKSHAATQDIPVIFYSFLQEQSSGSMLTLDYLSKPMAGAELGKLFERYGLSPSGGDSQRTVLIADDDPEILDMHARMVAEHIPGGRVARAQNGRIAVELMQELTPDLVLLDLMMPELDGAGVLRVMQADQRLRDIPVIVLTARALTREEMAHLNRGVVAVLSKGVFTIDETLAHIDQALARSKRVGTENQRLVRKVMAYIHENYAGPLTRQQLSRYAGVSERHLDRCFQQETGLSPNAYLNRYRIQQAKCLLKDSTRSISEVVEAVGFSDSSYFTHVFRREVGVTPREYQRGGK